MTPNRFTGSTILSPQTPISVDQGVRLTTVGEGGYFATMDRSDGSGSYTVTALTPVNGNDPGQLNLAALARDRHDLSGRDQGALPADRRRNARAERTRRSRRRSATKRASEAPIDLANQLVAELHSSTYVYQTDVRDVPCAGISTVECFATYKKGFCQYYAPTMAVILRHLGIPTRIAEGFLPGSRDQNAATEQILVQQRPCLGRGLLPGLRLAHVRPDRRQRVAARAAAVGQPDRERLAPADPEHRVAEAARHGARTTGGAGRHGAGPFPGGPASLGPLVAVLALLLLIVGAVAFLTWQRGPRGGTTADDAYGTVTRIASRFGFGPRPNQTVYEYAGVLGDVLPTVRPELETVARAKVESVYAREILGDERLASLKAAQRRLRVSLLRLAFRRKERRRRRRDPTTAPVDDGCARSCSRALGCLPRAAVLERRRLGGATFRRSGRRGARSGCGRAGPGDRPGTR